MRLVTGNHTMATVELFSDSHSFICNVAKFPTSVSFQNAPSCHLSIYVFHASNSMLGCPLPHSSPILFGLEIVTFCVVIDRSMMFVVSTTALGVVIADTEDSTV